MATEVLSSYRDTLPIMIKTLLPKMLESVVLLLPAFFVWPESFSFMILADSGP